MGTLFDDAYFYDTDDLFMSDDDRWDQAYGCVPLFLAAERPRTYRRAPPPASADEFPIADDFSDLA